MGFRPKYEWNEFRRNRGQYLLPNDEGKTVVYAYIRKNACSVFKSLMVERAQEQCAIDIDTIQEFRATAYLTRWDHAIFVYRDPYARAVSTFVNKFVEQRANAEIFENFVALTGKDPAKATFRDYVDYLNAPFEDLNLHFWPQKSHLAEIEYTDAIPMDNLAEAMKRILPSLADRFEKKTNVSVLREESTEDLCDVPADKLAGNAYGRGNFQTLRPVLEEIYAKDMAMIAEIEGAPAEVPAVETA